MACIYCGVRDREQPYDFVCDYCAAVQDEYEQREHYQAMEQAREDQYVLDMEQQWLDEQLARKEERDTKKKEYQKPELIRNEPLITITW